MTVPVPASVIAPISIPFATRLFVVEVAVIASIPITVCVLAFVVEANAASSLRRFDPLAPSEVVNSISIASIAAAVVSPTPTFKISVVGELSP